MAGNELSDLIESALTQVIQNYKGNHDGDMLVDWAVICYVTNPGEDQAHSDSYPLFFSNGGMPDYKARGLFHMALKFLDLERGF